MLVAEKVKWVKTGRRSREGRESREAKEARAGVHIQDPGGETNNYQV